MGLVNPYSFSLFSFSRLSWALPNFLPVSMLHNMRETSSLSQLNDCLPTLGESRLWGQLPAAVSKVKDNCLLCALVTKSCQMVTDGIFPADPLIVTWQLAWVTFSAFPQPVHATLPNFFHSLPHFGN